MKKLLLLIAVVGLAGCSDPYPSRFGVVEEVEEVRADYLISFGCGKTERIRDARVNSDGPVRPGTRVQVQDFHSAGFNVYPAAYQESK
jgi:hypothetical protein